MFKGSIKETSNGPLERVYIMISDPVLSILEPHKSPALHLRAAAGLDTNSRIGGIPRVPQGFEWPRWQDTSLAFLAQIDLAELGGAGTSQGLPDSGQLYFFYDQEQSTWGFDPADRGSWQVVYADAATSLVPLLPPKDVSGDYRYDEKLVSFEEIATYPSTESFESAGIELDDELWDRVEDQRIRPYEDMAHHQIGGHPDPVQGSEMPLECQLVSNGLYCGDETGFLDPMARELRAGAAEWQLLLQLDSDEDAGMMWGDCGLLYFWIQKPALEKRDFSNVWMILQCS